MPILICVKTAGDGGLAEKTGTILISRANASVPTAERQREKRAWTESETARANAEYVAEQNSVFVCALLKEAQDCLNQGTDSSHHLRGWQPAKLSAPASHKQKVDCLNAHLLSEPVGELAGLAGLADLADLADAGWRRLAQNSHSHTGKPAWCN